ncbi:MAG: S1 RNA-binding domain-containing protein [Planctomycetes bacterium]|nr:S1 RNA-binding domain-containing protein [Planctomycetota bacterium]
MRGERSNRLPATEHGEHTLRVWKGVVVGVYGRDVFVELGPRMQGLISVREFERAPDVGDEFEFTLRGREDGLWVLQRREAPSLATWEHMQVGDLVHARAIRAEHGGLELKIGPLHAFMPKSHTGLARDERPDVLVGKTLVCEVLEVDRERQRVLVSRKVVEQRERVDDRQRRVGALSIGQTVPGRVTRVEPYGVFVSLGDGLEGLIHVSNLAYERVEHPSALFRIGQTVHAKVLAVRGGGARVALGLKQTLPSPWPHAATRLPIGRIVEGTIKRVLPFGAFVLVAPGIEGLVAKSEVDLRGQRDLGALLAAGERVSVRVVSLDAERERLALSLKHVDGRAIAPDEAPAEDSFRELAEQARQLATPLGRLLHGALSERRDDDARHSA